VAPVPVPVPVPDAAPPRADVVKPLPPAVTFAVMSDLHLPNPKAANVATAVATILGLHPRFVVITGDFINGSGTDSPAVVKQSAVWWAAVAAALAPLRAAGIPILTVAGNHDSYLAGERAGYAATFADTPLAPSGKPPFDYAVDIDGLHLDLINLVDDAVGADVSTWLAADLATPAAKSARLRIAFSHVPWASVHQHRLERLSRELGPLLDAGDVNLYIAGHEHFVWDEDFSLPSGRMLRELLVGCTSGFYNYGPSAEEMKAAHCTPVVIPGKRGPVRCAMPNGGGAFVLAHGRKERMLQHVLPTFTLVTVDAANTVTATPMAVDGTPFYLPVSSAP
jgi:3',5'-cyclic AMP phosphodiesterase CpdA